MIPSIVLEALSRTTKPLGYNKKSNMLWRKGSSLASHFHVQKSQWNDGCYINFGIMPTALFIKKCPPPSHEWPLRDRAETLDGPYHSLFLRLISAEDQTPDASEIQDAVLWLTNWVEENLAEPDTLRHAILTQDPNSGLAMLGTIPTEWVMYDWARGQLKDAASYFPAKFYKYYQ